MHKEYYILDDILDIGDCQYLYHKLNTERKWSLIGISNHLPNDQLRQFNSFPNLLVERDEVVHHDFLSGYFRSLTHKVRHNLKKEQNLTLPQKIKRIHLNANNSNSRTGFHKDIHNDTAWSILVFLNPVWNNEDGGELYIENTKILYKPARIIVFKSNLNHKGGFVTNNQLRYWRLSLNIVLCD